MSKHIQIIKDNELEGEVVFKDIFFFKFVIVEASGSFFLYLCIPLEICYLTKHLIKHKDLLYHICVVVVAAY